MKIFISFFLLNLIVFSVHSQSKDVYSVEIYSLKSKSIRGYVAEVGDTSVTLRYRKKTYNICYCNISKIKVYREKNQPIYFYPSFAGMALLATSPFKSTLEQGLTTAGLGLGIIVLSAAMNVTFEKAIEKIEIDSTKNIKGILQKYLFILPPDWKK